MSAVLLCLAIGAAEPAAALSAAEAQALLAPEPMLARKMELNKVKIIGIP
ncbi:hypothetical protein [Malikia spinosa]